MSLGGLFISETDQEIVKNLIHSVEKQKITKIRQLTSWICYKINS